MRLWNDGDFWHYIRAWDAYFWQFYFGIFIAPMELNIFISLDEGFFWNEKEAVA